MLTIYQFILFIHVVSVTLTIGPFFILFPAVKRLLTADSESTRVYLGLFRSVIRLSKHAGHVLVGSGILLVLLGSWSWTTSWLLITIIVLVGSLLFFARAFSPTLRKLEASADGREPLVRKLRWIILVYVVLLLIMLWFMVARPTLW